MRKPVIILPLLFLLIGFVFRYYDYQINKITENERQRIKYEQRIQAHQMIQSHFMKKIKDKAHLILKKKMKISGYAPLDPKAVKGMCYSGDPKVTASGRRTQPGITIAAGKNIPFGTLIFIPTIGWREVEDRGGSIGNNRIDICFETKEEAIAWGIQEHEVYILFPMEGE